MKKTAPKTKTCTRLALVMCIIFCLFLPPVNAGGTAIYGDVNMDNAVTAGDALLALQKAVGKIVLTEEQSVVADVDRNKGITASDALLILQYAVRRINVFPAEKYISISDIKEELSYEAVAELQFTFKPAQAHLSVVQGAYFDGEYYYVAVMYQGYNEELAVIHVLDRFGNLVRCSSELALDHANNITYNPDIDKLVVSHCQGAKESKFYTYSFVDPQTLEITYTGVKEFPFFSIAYSPEKQQYASGRWGGETLDICDKDMNLIKTVDVTRPTSLSQGVFADEKYIYFVRSSTELSGCELLVYDWNCELKHKIAINGLEGLEPENINIVDGTAYIICNSAGAAGGSAYTLSFIEKDQ